MTFVDSIDQIEPRTQVLVSDQATTGYFSYNFPVAEEVIIHDVIVKAKHISKISLTIGAQVVSTSFKIGADGNYHLSRPNFLAPFAHRYHELGLIFEFSQPSSVTIERVISIPSIETVKLLTSQRFHSMSFFDGSRTILRYDAGMVGVLYM